MTSIGRKACAVAIAHLVAATWIRAQDFPPGQPTAPDTGRAFTVAPSSSISDQNYGIAHRGGSLSIANIDFSEGLANFTLELNIAPWVARNSEGIFYAEIWVEQFSGGSWTGAIEGYSGVYAVNVNSGTPPGGGWSWSKPFQNVAPGTQFRAFGYCYMYNQGGGSQGEYALYSWMDPVTVPAPVQMTPPLSANSTATVGLGWAPAVYGGEGTGAYLYCVVGQTNFANLSNLWTPAAAGVYSFNVGQLPDGTNAGNVTDPILGEMEVNPTPYTLTVSKASQAVVSADATLVYGQPFAPAYYEAGGYGSGLFQFCIVGYTNFNGGASSDTGTNDPARGNAWEISWPAPSVGTYQFMVAEDGNAAFNPANPGTYYNLTVTPATPPTVTVSPSSASVAAGDSVSFVAVNGLNGYAWSVSPAGPAGISGNGAGQTLTFPESGSYIVSAFSPAGGNYTASNTASAIVSVSTPQYTLTTMAVGNGTVTAGGTYPANTVLALSATPGANATFAGWTGSLASQSNPLSVTLTGNLTLFGNFSALQSQVIAFTPPAEANYPGPPISLAAAATSGLPVSFTVLSGPASLSGSTLTLAGTGTVAVQASQAGNAQWLPASPVIATINTNAPPSIARFRFDSAGHGATTSARGAGFGASSLWTDPTGLQSSPWPSFASPVPAIPRASNVQLPAVPAAPPLSP
ncbi:MAG: hypothetical protein ABSA05_02905 [Opitutaceae bacterium]